MAVMTTTKCPNCGKETFIAGKLIVTDRDGDERSSFYPKNVFKKNSIHFLREASVRMDSRKEYFACYGCGHFWGKVDLVDYNNVLNKFNWDPNSRNAPATRDPWFVKVALYLLLPVLALYILIWYFGS